MPDGDSSATAVIEALTPAPSTTEATATDSSPESTADSTQAAAPEKTSSEPDYKEATEKFLATPEGRKYLLEHAEIKKEIDHRSKSVREADIDRRATEKAAEIVRQNNARLEEQAQARLRQAQQEQSDSELWREIEDDPTSPLAQRLRPELEARKSARQTAAAEEQVMQRLAPTLQQRAEVSANQRLIAMLTDAIQQDPSLSDDDRAELNPLNPKYTDHLSFLSAWRDLSSGRQAKELAKTLAKTEAAAMLATERATNRQQEKAPVTLPPGEGGLTDEQFMADYGAGKSNNTARQLKWMRDNGIIT
ncbi:MAG: hypothetical protein Q7O66_17490 [Dehalococcoidia bacterium]|nr:hypothetical protein [Dehalococcoidia bacterium]